MTTYGANAKCQRVLVLAYLPGYYYYRTGILKYFTNLGIERVQARTR